MFSTTFVRSWIAAACLAFVRAAGSAQSFKVHVRRRRNPSHPAISRSQIPAALRWAARLKCQQISGGYGFFVRPWATERQTDLFGLVHCRDSKDASGLPGTDVHPNSTSTTPAASTRYSSVFR